MTFKPALIVSCLLLAVAVTPALASDAATLKKQREKYLQQKTGGGAALDVPLAPFVQGENTVMIDGIPATFTLHLPGNPYEVTDPVTDGGKKDSGLLARLKNKFAPDEEEITEPFVGDAGQPPYPALVVLAANGMPSSPLSDPERHASFNRAANRHGFAVIYFRPQPFWNYGDRQAAMSGRGGRNGPPPAADDKKRVSQSVKLLAAQGVIDPARTYLAGLGTSVPFGWELLCQDRLDVAGAAFLMGLPYRDQLENCPLKKPMPFALLHGDADTIFPAAGGMSHPIGNRRELGGADEVEKALTALNGVARAQTGAYPDVYEDDGTTAVRKTLEADDPQIPKVTTITVRGGGQMFPAGNTARYQPPHADSAVFGRKNRDFDAAEEIWAFFKGDDQGDRRK